AQGSVPGRAEARRGPNGKRVAALEAAYQGASPARPRLTSAGIRRGLFLSAGGGRYPLPECPGRLLAQSIAEPRRRPHRLKSRFYFPKPEPRSRPEFQGRRLHHPRVPEAGLFEPALVACPGIVDPGWRIDDKGWP